MSILERRFSTVQIGSGMKLHCAEQGASQGLPILFLHGWPDSWYSWSRVLDHLPPTVHAIVPDQRGFGDSSKPPDGYAIGELGTDAVALLDSLSIERAILVGHSFGSFVARSVAATRPDRVSGLVLIGTGWTAANAVTRDVLAAITDLEDPAPFAFVREFQSSTVHLPVAPAFFERILEESRKLPAPLWRATFRNLLSFDDREALSRLTMRSLLIWGDHDALFAREDQDRLMGTLPDVHLEVYEDTGHCPNWERPEHVASDLVRFMHRVNPSLT